MQLTTRVARLRLALLLLLCGFAGLAGVQPHDSEAGGSSETVARWEHFSQGIPSDKLNARPGPRTQSPDRDSYSDHNSNPAGDDPLDLAWDVFALTAVRIRPGLATATLPDPPERQLCQPLKHSPRAAQAPPLA